MASLRKRGKVWYFRYTDADGDKREVRGCADKRETEAMARAAETEVAQERNGVFDEFKPHRLRPLEEHLTEYIAYLESKGNTPEHVRLVAFRIRAIMAGCDFHQLKDLDAPRVANWLAQQRKPKDAGGVNMSIQTSNHYMTQIKAFATWLTVHRRMRSNPLLALEHGSVDADRRLVRRALLEDELFKLLDYARQAPPVEGMPGLERAWLYCIASMTGYRLSELAVLTPESFRLDAAPPAVVLAAQHTKNGKPARQTIGRPLAEALRPWIASKAPGEPVFSMPAAHMGRVVKTDLKACGIPVVDADGREVDLHAMRGGYVSMLARAGTNVKVLQSLARHSDPRLTLNIYTSLSTSDAEAAVEALPDFAAKLAHYLPTRNPGEQQTTADNGGIKARKRRSTKAPETLENKGNSGQRRTTADNDMERRWCESNASGRFCRPSPGRRGPAS